MPSYEVTMQRVFRFRHSRAPACPRVVVGKRCLIGYPSLRRQIPNALCLCQRFRPRPLDHARMWLDREGRHVLTAEPYDLTPEGLAAFRAGVEPLGIEVTVGARGYWHEGTTLLVCTERHPYFLSAEDVLGPTDG